MTPSQPATLPTSVLATVDRVADALGPSHPRLARLFRSCYPNTLETTTEALSDGTTFVFTGDIPAMWLRDSAAQVRPYVPLAAHDPELRQLVRGLIWRQAAYLLIDPYANAFNREPNGRCHNRDRTAMGPWIWERKFELDSLCYPVQLLQEYWQATGDRSVFSDEVHAMLRQVVQVMVAEQHHEAGSPYSFERDNSTPLDTLPRDGRGAPTAYTGMVWSGFRPSDDACTYGYLVPANMFAVVVLGHLATFAETIYGDLLLAVTASRLRDEIRSGIERHGVVEHPQFGPLYAYETDGLGNHLLMDDANVPSLLAIPYLGYKPASDQLVRNTRAFVLSPANPSYAAGRYARGVGSPHTPPGYIWPIALTMQALTAEDPAERLALIETLAATTGGTDFMHESFDPDAPERFTRPWFAWANSLFGELVLRWLDEDQPTQGA